MKNPFAPSLVYSVLLLAASLAGSGSLSASEVPPAASETNNQRILDLRESMQALEQARQLYSKGRYTDSVELYRVALAKLPRAKATQKQLLFIQESLSDALIARAMDYRKVGRRDEAISFLKEAIELAPRSQRAKAELTITLDPLRTSPALTPSHVANVNEVNRLLTLAYSNYDLGLFDEAIASFKAVLAIDSYNTAAHKGIQAVNQRKANYYGAMRNSVRTDARKDVIALWGKGGTSGVDFVQDMETPAVENVSPTVDLAEQQANDYLERVIVPTVAFEDATIDDVMSVLRAYMRRAGAELGAPPSPLNLVGNFGTPDSESMKLLKEKRLSLVMNQVSMRVLLDTVASQMGLTWYHTPVGVELSYSGKDFGPLIDRSFLVPPYFFERASEDEGGDDPFADGGGSVGIKRVNAMAELKKMGISFPAGANARYIPSSRMLHVRNTSYNMAEIADMLNVQISPDKAVVLNVYVMSVNKRDLEDLGFDVMLNLSISDNTYGGGGTAASTVASAANPLPEISTMGPGEQASVNSGLRSIGEIDTRPTLDEIVSSGSVGNFANRAIGSKSPSVFGFRGIWNSADLTVLMRGLNQKTNVDVYQNPQVIFTPGNDEQVSIASIREFYYPELYDAPEVQTTTFYGNIGLDDIIGGDASAYQGVMVTPAHPSEFTRIGITEDQFDGIGTILQVHSAEVEENGQYVTIALSTTVNEFEGFINWGTPIRAALTTDNEIVSFQINENPILKPLIKRQYENTKVTIANGSVIVLGGLQESKKVRYEDKVPVIGDLPLVGRLFRSEGTETEERVLLFFAKVDVVDPTGVNVSTGKNPSEK